MYLSTSAAAELAWISTKSDRCQRKEKMNWKALLPAATLLVLFVPSAAFSRNHHSGNMYQNGMMSQLGNGGQYYGASNHSINPMISAGVNPYANVGAYGANAFANNGLNFAGNNGMLGMNSMNGMNGMGMCQRHRHKHKRRGMLQSLLNNGGGYGNSGFGNMGYGNQGMMGYGNRGLMGNSYGYGGGMTGGLRNMLGRL
jgi:hypothetical protein